MLQIIAVLLLTLVQKNMATDNIAELLKKHPTWSFELESVESVVKKGMEAIKDVDPSVTEDMIRQKIKREFGPDTTHIARKTGDPKWSKVIPQSFDLRDKFKECAHLITDVDDEGSCHTDSHTLVASIASDRYCMFTNGTHKEKLSSEYLIGCAEFCTRNPYIRSSWAYATRVGLPSGGPYRSKSGCIPLTSAPCRHTVAHYTGQTKDQTMRAPHKKDKLKPCDQIMAYDHDCPTKCSNPKYSKPLEEDLKTFTTSYRIATNEYSIRTEIFTNGPVATSILLYDDFFDHKEGMYYRNSTSKFVAMDKYFKLIGWGKEDGKNYWLAVNSWTDWGENKIFKIERGTNYLWIEYFLSTGTYDPL